MNAGIIWVDNWNKEDSHLSLYLCYINSGVIHGLFSLALVGNKQCVTGLFLDKYELKGILFEEKIAFSNTSKSIGPYSIISSEFGTCEAMGWVSPLPGRIMVISSKLSFQNDTFSA